MCLLPEIQLAQIGGFIDRSTAPTTTHPDIINGVNRLADAVAERQQRLRSEFADHFALFASNDSRRLYKETFKAR